MCWLKSLIMAFLKTEQTQIDELLAEFELRTDSTPISLVAGEALTAGMLVNVYNASGVAKLRKASTDPGYEADGFVSDDVGLGSEGVLRTGGKLVAIGGGLTVGAMYYLSSTYGYVSSAASTAAGKLVQRIGRATSATEIAFNPSQPIELYS